MTISCLILYPVNYQLLHVVLYILFSVDIQREGGCHYTTRMV